jgi:hypothetical protein
VTAFVFGFSSHAYNKQLSVFFFDWTMVICSDDKESTMMTNHQEDDGDDDEPPAVSSIPTAS